MSEKYVLYRPEVETKLEDEEKIIDEIIKSMTRLSGRTREKFGGERAGFSFQKPWVGSR